MAKHRESDVAAPVATGITLHLTPEDVWAARKGRELYQPDGFADEGFIHCTDGEANLIDVGNMFYRADSRPFLVLDVDLSRVNARAIYEDNGRIYPHIYGPLELDAVVRVRRVDRAVDGTFLEIREHMDATEGTENV